MTFSILKYGCYKKMTFSAFVGHERYKLFWSLFIAIVGVLLSSFVIVSFLLTSYERTVSYVNDSRATDF